MNPRPEAEPPLLPEGPPNWKGDIEAPLFEPEPEGSEGF